VKIALICIGTVLGLIVLAGIVLYLVGRAQPERHTASISITFALLDVDRAQLSPRGGQDSVRHG